ncbi:MAG: hypothetical protein JSV19_07260 [Phycisphaerales bacterium]|nr:MAG: hypothetical protein JSV19_07260 [Phycisphaerales bacterium]
MHTNEDIERALTTLRVIIGAMLAGMIAFGAVAVVLGRQADDTTLATPLLVVLIVLSLGAVPTFVITRAVLRNRVRHSYELRPPTEDQTGKLVPILMTLTIIGAAMAEGVGLFGLVIYVITGTVWALIAPVVAILALVLQLPSRDKLNRFVADVTGQHSL